MNLPREVYKYKGGSEQVASESQEYFILDRIETVFNHNGRSFIKRIYEDKMFKLKSTNRDEIIKYLSTVNVPASIGKDLMQIVELLIGLEEIPTEVVENEK